LKERAKGRSRRRHTLRLEVCGLPRLEESQRSLVVSTLRQAATAALGCQADWAGLAIVLRNLGGCDAVEQQAHRRDDQQAHSGTAAECDTPAALLTRPHSLQSRMVASPGQPDRLTMSRLMLV